VNRKVLLKKKNLTMKEKGFVKRLRLRHEGDTFCHEVEI
jgi:hypothetical protein